MATRPLRGASPLRGEARIRAIEAATLELLAEVGYEALTIGAVAERATASKMTIYRQWDGKRELVISALVHAETAWPQLPPDSGSLRGDLVELCRLVGTMSGTDEARRFSGLLHAAQDDEQIALALDQRVAARRRADCAEVLARAAARSEIPDADGAETLFEVLGGLALIRTILQSQPFDDAYVDHVVDDILLPVVLRRSP